MFVIHLIYFLISVLFHPTEILFCDFLDSKSNFACRNKNESKLYWDVVFLNNKSYEIKQDLAWENLERSDNW